MGPKWGPHGSCRPQMGPMLVSWTLLSARGSVMWKVFPCHDIVLFPQVWCDMAAQPPRAYVAHDQMSLMHVDGYGDSCDQNCTGCWKPTVTYKGVDLLSTVRLLVESSESCTYAVYFKCRYADPEAQGFFDHTGTYQHYGTSGAICAGKIIFSFLPHCLSVCASEYLSALSVMFRSGQRQSNPLGDQGTKVSMSSCT